MLFRSDLLDDIFSPTKKGKAFTIEHIMTDSRVSLENSLFVPIIGDRFNGHQFLADAIKNGAVASIWQKGEPVPSEIKDDFVFYYVDDTLVALQELARKYLQEVKPIIIGITGSNGKTTTKDLLYAVLKQKYRTHCTAGNFNNHIGLPLTILNMPTETEVVILEMGMDTFGEIDLLANIARPQIAVITNIGESHIENLGSREGIAKAKLEITHYFTQGDILIVDGDEPLLKNTKVESISCGFTEANQMLIHSVALEKELTKFTIEDMEYTIPLIGKHHAKNAAYAILIAKKLGLKEEEIQAGLMDLQHSNMRFEQLIGKNGVHLINDAYNASPTSIKGAIEVVKQMDSYAKKILVLGDVLELGEFSQPLHQSIADVITKPIDLVYTYGEYAFFITEQLRENKSPVQAEHFSDKASLIKELEKQLTDDTVILFKASRGMAFETLVEACLNKEV